MTLKKLLGSPITHSEYLELRAKCSSSYHYELASGDLACPIFINPLINLQAFHNFISNPDVKVEGVRFYPGFESNKLILSMCHDKGDDKKYKATAWSTLLNNLYLDPNAVLSTKDHDKAKRLKDNYDSLVYIDRKIQVPGDRTRISRFYTYEELDTLINQNVPSKDYQNYFIQIEWGMVSDDLKTVFFERCKVDNADQHYGFTVLFHIKDQDGNPLIDTIQPYQAGRYQKTYLEVGSPCPPRCGDI
jgi:hypothetical protein